LKRSLKKASKRLFKFVRKKRKKDDVKKKRKMRLKCP